MGLSGIDRADSSRPMAESRKCDCVLAKRNIFGTPIASCVKCFDWRHCIGMERIDDADVVSKPIGGSVFDWNYTGRHLRCRPHYLPRKQPRTQ